MHGTCAAIETTSRSKSALPFSASVMPCPTITDENEDAREVDLLREDAHDGPLATPALQVADRKTDG
jgi:hypothetical protein